MTYLKGYVLELAVFVCGALIMIFEIVGSRIVAPFIGTSTYVWTSLIGVILASLSLGYWFGGRMADRRPDPKVLAAAIFIAGGLVSATVLTKEIVLTFAAALPIGLELRSLVASMILFAPASVAFGFVTPYAVRLRMSSLEDSGKTVGRLYALSTIGSIAGTFAAGFFLIPFVGSVRTLYLIAVCLILLSIFLAPLKLDRTRALVFVLLGVGILGTELSTWYLRSLDVYDFDTEYNRVQIYSATDSKSGRPIRALSIDPFFVQSVIYLDGEELFAKYTPYYHLVRYLRPGFQRTLMIGGAGYSFPQDYLRTYPNAAMDVVEIDPAMTRIAREQFRLIDDLRLASIHEDGRTFINRSEPGQYDAVMLDAFGSLFSVPFHLTTVEAVRHISRVLKDDGVVIFNVGSALTGRSSRFLRAELATYQTVFPDVIVLKVDGDRSDEDTQNLMIVACKTICPTGPATDDEIARLLSHRYSKEIDTTVAPLTDDLAPVEYYNSFAQATYRQ